MYCGPTTFAPLPPAAGPTTSAPLPPAAGPTTSAPLPPVAGRLTASASPSHIVSGSTPPSELVTVAQHQVGCRQSGRSHNRPLAVLCTQARWFGVITR
ncbi:hypothetical protein Taro_032434 [Colocasia esculenta]|uniref:Uncharacterized protein n=1 Tax=Colocasia esculenta TaxID=4460 RepID=A0A843VZ61_COLES|nr:hypothetical protein [Colocasia esculenta]